MKWSFSQSDDSHTNTLWLPVISQDGCDQTHRQGDNFLPNSKKSHQNFQA